MKVFNILNLRKFHIEFVILCFVLLFLCGCNKNSGPAETEIEVTSAHTSEIRDNTPLVLVPEYNEDKVFGNEYLSLDTSNSNCGYFFATYLSDKNRAKLQLSGNGSITYTYNLHPGRSAVIPLAMGSGDYSITAYEEIRDGEYALIFATDISVALDNELNPFLYPNEYVNFTESSKTVSTAADVVATATCDLDAVGMVFDYIVQNVTYDHEKAENVPSGYIPDVDEILEIKTGICFDYAALMASMLRSQRIPTRLEIGYADDAYHAWISVYVEDQGWINNIIEFNGTTWTLMDPTFTANQTNNSISQLIGNGTDYVTMYTY